MLYLPELEAGAVAVSARTTIVRFRRDLRLAENPALAHAVTHAEQVAYAYLDVDSSASFAPDAASRA